MKNFKFFFNSLLTLFVTFNLFAQTTGSRPNIIVILADDLGYADVGFNRDANFPEDLGIIPTPHLDQLAHHGIICKNAHVAHPFCGPSRAGLLTGMYPHRIGAQYNLPNDITSSLGIPTNETFFSKVLQENNYNTAAFGKWHLGFTEGKYQPLDRGFDYFFGFLGGGKNYFERIYEKSFYNRINSSNPVKNEYQDPLQRNRSYVAKEEFGENDYLTDLLTDEAIGYIEKNKNDKDPFFMYVAYNAPHTPLQAPADEIEKFKQDNPNFEKLVRNSKYITKSIPLKRAKDETAKAKLLDKFVEARITYATMVSNMDTNIGRIVSELKKDKKVFDNTIIVFLSDNGGYTYAKGAVNYPLLALKGSVFDGGHKVPMLVHWPKAIKKYHAYKYQISALDLYPTLTALAGAKLPKHKILDGKNFMDPIIANKNLRKPGEAIFILRPQKGFHNTAIMTYPWTIVKSGANAKWKLYDTEKDPGQKNDVSTNGSKSKKIIKKLKGQAIDWIKEFKEVKPSWFDHERGAGHPHRKMWFTSFKLPQYNTTFETNSLK